MPEDFVTVFTAKAFLATRIWSFQDTELSFLFMVVFGMDTDAR